MRDFLRGYRTIIFNLSLVIIGIMQKIDVEIPQNVVIITHELLKAVGIQNLDGSTLISVGVAGLMLRAGTSTRIGKRA